MCVCVCVCVCIYNTSSTHVGLHFLKNAVKGATRMS